MFIKGDVAIRAPRKCVWDFLTIPNQIGQYVPGAEKIASIELNKKYCGIVSPVRGGAKVYCFCLVSGGFVEAYR